MLCHKCPHQREINRLRELCCQCVARDAERAKKGKSTEMDNPSGKGHTTVSLDAMQEPEGILRQSAAYDPTRVPSEPVTLLPEDVEMRLRSELASFLRLSFMNQMLLIWVMRGESLSEFSRLDWLPKGAKSKGFLTRQAAGERIDTLKKNCPGIAGVIEQMIALNSGNRGRTKQKLYPKKRR